MSDTQSIILIVLVLLIIYYVFNFTNLFVEKYSSKSEKANVIYNWFTANPHPRYEKYKSDVKDSDIIEYTDAKKEQIMNRNNFSPDNIKNKL